MPAQLAGVISLLIAAIEIVSKYILQTMRKYDTLASVGNHRAKSGFTLQFGGADPPDGRKEGDTMYVTYQDLIQIGILIVALGNLIYQIYKGKKK